MTVRLPWLPARACKATAPCAGSLTAGPGSTVSPGQSLGVLTVTNAVLLQGTTVVEIDKTAGTNDLLGGAASITYGGTLVVSNLSAALTNGDSFKLFDADAYSGAFTNIMPKRPGPGLAWDTSGLTDSGTLGGGAGGADSAFGLAED